MEKERLQIQDNPELSRYEGRLGGALAGYCDYVTAGPSLILPHTETLPEYRGRGVADAIVGFALADARRQGLSVIARCWFVEEYMRSHPADAPRLEGSISPRV
jgi:predicted GNAT family acetyltransferase